MNPLPKKPLTWILAIIHIIWIVGVMWVGVFIVPPAYRIIWVLVMISEYVHWRFIKGECMMSYWEKKSEDPSYKLGDNPELTYAWVLLGSITGLSMKQLRMFHAQITQLVFMYALADIILVQNPLHVEYYIRTIVFLIVALMALQYVSFDSFNLLTNDLKNK